MIDLDTLLKGKEPEEEQKKEINFGLNELHISRYTYEKAFKYAKFVVKIKRRNSEIGGFLTTPKNAQDRVARDAFLTRDQLVSAVNYKLDAEKVLEAGKEIESQGNKIIGWWHSHGRGTSYHSDVDDENQMVLLNQIAPSNYITLPQEKTYENLQSRVEGDKIIFWDPENPNTKYQLELKKQSPELVAERLKILKDKKIGFAYSFVVNFNRWLRKRVPYSEIATRDLCRSCMNPEDVSIPVKHKIFDEGEFYIDDNKLIEEIKDKVYTYGEVKENKTYFLPEVFEEKRANGTLTKPKFHETSKYSFTPEIVDSEEVGK